MEEIMQSNSFFIVPLTISYLGICGLWFLATRNGKIWELSSIENSAKPLLDIGLGILAFVGIFLIGQLYSAGYLIPDSGIRLVDLAIVWPINNVIIYSPIFMVLRIRRQGLNTVFISSNSFLKKLGFGFLASVIGVLVFIALRGEWNRIPEITHNAVQLKSISNFPAVFFENVALAFLFVRLKWATNLKWAIAIPSILFALAHVPGSLSEGDPWSHIITFFFLTGGLTTAILYTVYRSRDIIWLGVVHYLMDVVIKAF